MALITNNISGSSSNLSQIGITGSVIISNDPIFPSFPGTDVVFFVSGSNDGTNKASFGGDLVVSGTISIGGDSLEVTGTISATQGFSGSLTQLVDGTSYLIAGTNITITSASNGAVTVDATGGSPGGNDTEIQYNSGGSFAGSSNFTYNGSTVFLTGSFSQGEQNTAEGLHSHAEGYFTTTVADHAHAEGFATQAIGQGAHSEGSNTIASGSYSHTEGYITNANGQYAHAEGYQSYAGALGYISNDAGSTTPGLIVLNSSYGDVSAFFSPGGYITLDDTSYSGVYQYKVFEIAAASYVGSNTEITLVNSTVSTPTGASIGIQGGISPPGADQPMGSYSHSEGLATTADGYGAHAEGVGTIASGYGSHSEGGTTISIGNRSHAEGDTSRAIGDTSHAEGQTTYAIGVGSHSEGYVTTASGIYSHTEGSTTVASGDYSHAEGSSTFSLGDSSHAQGAGASAISNHSHAEGEGTYSGYKGFGTSNIIAGAVVINSSYGDVSSLFTAGSYSLLTWASKQDQAYEISSGSWDGTNTIVTLVDTSINDTRSGLIGIRSTSLPSGADLTTSGVGSHAEGFQTIAQPRYSHAEGYETLALAARSHAEGDNTTTLGIGSHSEGLSTIASGSYQHVSGKFNVRNNDFSLFIVGNGTSDLDVDRSDVLRVNSGSIGDGRVEVTGSLAATMGLSGSLTTLADGTSYLIAGSNIAITSASNGAVTISSATATSYYLNLFAGTISSTAASASMESIGMDYYDVAKVPAGATSYTFQAILATTLGTTAYMDLYDYNGIVTGIPGPISGSVLTGSNQSYTYLTADLTPALSAVTGSGIIEARIWCDPTGINLNAICKNAKLEIS